MVRRGKPNAIAGPRTDKTARELLAEGVPPQNLDAERAALGSVLRDNATLLELTKKLRPDHFYAAHHARIYETMLKMFETASPIDALTLAEGLTKLGIFKEIGGAPAILDIRDETLTAANSRYYAQIVYEKGVMRQLIHACTDILRDAYDTPSTADEMLATAEKRIFSLLESRVAGDAVDMKELMQRVFDRLHERQQGGGIASGVPSGFIDLDEMTNGWQNSELIILAARPSMGKTAFALNLIEHAAVDCKLPVLFASLEMSELEIAERMLCARARVNSHHLRRGRVGSDDMNKLLHASEELSVAPIFVDDTPGQTMLRISATARRLKLRPGLSMVVIDYLQLIEADDKSVSRQEQISTISRRLKNLARELKVPVIALSQLNRSVETREGHKPRMADLRESGSIEQDADVVAMLHRDDAYDKEENPGQAELIIAKQRNGPVGDVKLTFVRELTRFESFRPEMAAFGGGFG